MGVTDHRHGHQDAENGISTEFIETQPGNGENGKQIGNNTITGRMLRNINNSNQPKHWSLHEKPKLNTQRSNSGETRTQEI